MTDDERDDLNGLQEVRQALCCPENFEVDDDGNVTPRTTRPDGLVRVVVSQSVVAVPPYVDWRHEFPFGNGRYVEAVIEFEFAGQEKPSRPLFGDVLDPPLGTVGLLYSVEIRT